MDPERSPQVLHVIYVVTESNPLTEFSVHQVRLQQFTCRITCYDLPYQKLFLDQQKLQRQN